MIGEGGSGLSERGSDLTDEEEGSMGGYDSVSLLEGCII